MPSHRRTSPRRGAGRSLLAVGAALLLTSGCFGWGQRGYDAGKTSNNPSEKTLTAATVAGLTPVWSMPGNVARTVSSGNRAHVLHYDGEGSKVTTLNAATGAVAWSSFAADHPVGGNYIAVVGQTLAITSGETTACSGAGCGDIYWTRNHGYDIATGQPKPHPFAQNDQFMIPADGDAAVGAHVALVPATDHQWQAPRLAATFDGTTPDTWVGEGAQPNPLLDDEAQVAYTTPATNAGDPVINAWPVSCGQPCSPLWTHPGSTEFAAFDAATDTVYVAGDQIEAVDAADGSVEWTAQLSSWHRPAIRNGTIYAIGNGLLSAIPDCGGSTCGPAWTGTELTGTIAPIIAGDVVYTASSNAGATRTTVHAWDADGCGTSQCDPLATVSAIGSPEDMLVAGGRLVVQTSAGVYAFGLPA